MYPMQRDPINVPNAPVPQPIRNQDDNQIPLYQLLENNAHHLDREMEVAGRNAQRMANDQRRPLQGRIRPQV